MKKSAIYVAILLIILIIAVVLCIGSINRGHSPGETETPAPAETTEPPRVNIETPEPTEPEPTVTPTPTAPPVFETKPPVETEPPASARPAAEMSGSFTSNTGTGLNLLVEWFTFVDANGDYKLGLDVSAVSYSFYTDSMYNAIEIQIGDYSAAMSSPSVSYSGSDQAITPLISTTVDAPSGATNISVTWNYRGSYSGVELDKISASGTAYLP